MSATRPKCAATTRSGAPCQAAPISRSTFCFTHDPGAADARRSARSKGGAARHGRKIAPGDPAPIELRTTGDFLRWIEQTANDLAQLENSISRARTVASLAGVGLKAIELDTLAHRVDAIEAILKTRNEGSDE